MKILFRVDAGGKIGLGHFFRSVALADKLKAKGHLVYFVSQRSEFWKCKVQEGFSYPHFEMINANSELDLIEKLAIDIFFVDGIIEYQPTYISNIKALTKLVFYQNSSTSKHLCDVFILPSIHQSAEFFTDFTSDTAVYQGLEYFTCNPTIANLTSKTGVENVRNIAFTAGGSDPDNTLMRLYSQIDFKRFREQSFNFYFGSDYLHWQSVPEETLANVRLVVYEHTEILKNDLLIGAFGVSIYEFLALGMPIIAFGHQKSTAWAADVLADKTEALISLGCIEDMTPKLLNDTVDMLVNDHPKRAALSGRAKRILDFDGADRIVTILEKTIENERR